MKHPPFLIYLLIFISFFLILFTKFTPQKEISEAPSVSSSPQNLFLATSSGHQITIFIYDAISTKFTQKNYTLDDFVSRNTHIKYDNANYSIQFNPQNKDIFILADGYDGTKSNPCVNKDQTCKNRIYKTNLDESDTHLLFETDKEINNWIIDPNTNSIQFISYINNQNFLENIDASSGKLNYSQLFSGYIGFFTISNNDQIYQTFTSNSPGSKNSTLKLYKINPHTNDIEETKTIDTDGFFNHQTSLSPNNQFLAYYKFDNQTKKRFLSFYDFTADIIIYNFPIENAQTSNLYWSQDNTKIIHQQNQSYWLFDLNNQRDEKIIDDRKLYGWNSGLGLLVATNKDNQIIIYNQFTKTEISFPNPVVESNTYGLFWF